MSKIVLSAVVLTKNEEQNIDDCLKSLSFCDEILLIDDESTDSTLDLAKKHNVKIISHPLNADFAAQRNFGLEQVKGDWVLFVDADECISVELKKNIENAIQSDSNFVAYSLKRRDHWWGQELRYGEVKKVRDSGLVRLVKKLTGEWKSPVHETFVSRGAVGMLDGFIEHYPHQTLAEFLHEINVYSTYRAKELLNAGQKVSIVSIVLYPFGKFFLTYILRGGFLDGAAGFAYAFLMSFHSFLVRSKLYQYLYIDAKKT